MSNRLYRKLIKRILLQGLTGLEKYHVQCGNKKAAVDSVVRQGVKRLTAVRMVNEYWRDVYSY